MDGPAFAGRECRTGILSPALTTRGMGLEEMTRVAELIDEVLTRKDDATIERVRSDVEELAAGFPLYDRASVRKLAHA